MRKLLWVGDAGCQSGFAKATHEILASLDYRSGGEYDVTVLALNYIGDPYKLPYDLYACAPGGDSFGIGRLIWMCDLVKPDVIVIQNDGWNFPLYTEHLKHFPQYAEVPVVAVVAVDGLNFHHKWLERVQHAIFWTDFALKEARAGGYEGPADVIPLGVDMSTFKPMDRPTVRAQMLSEGPRDGFIVGTVNRNQPRKRWDLTIKYFAEWIKKEQIKDSWLFMHAAPTGDTGIDVRQLARYYGVADRVGLVEPQVHYGYPDAHMALTYNTFDVAISTTQGEGMGLTALEAMACGVPCILPDWSAFGDWAQGAAWLVPCTTTAIGPPYVNVIGGIPDQAEFTKALNRMYRDKAARKTNAQAALERASEDRFRWANIGKRYVEVLSNIFEPKVQKVPALTLVG